MVVQSRPDLVKTGFLRNLRALLTVGAAFCVCVGARAAAPILTNMTIVGTTPQFEVHSQLGQTNEIQCRTNLNPENWVGVASVMVTQSPYCFEHVGAAAASQRFYRVLATEPGPSVPTNMALIPAGSFTMGQPGATAANGPEHTVTVSAFLLDTHLVSYTLWADVCQWATHPANGYSFGHAGAGKAAKHPVQKVDWHDAVKWCNARSEREGRTPCYYTDATRSTIYKSGTNDLANDCVNWAANGYRLPTEAEWERAARGGVNGFRFPWGGDTISQARANYFANTLNYNYDYGPTGYNPIYSTGDMPYTSPVGAFARNAFGLYDMAGNLAEWCWDWYSRYYYQSSPSTDPRGPSTATYRTTRGGSWQALAPGNACYSRDYKRPTTAANTIGFRCVRGL